MQLDLRTDADPDPGSVCPLLHQASKHICFPKYDNNMTVLGIKNELKLLRMNVYGSFFEGRPSGKERRVGGLNIMSTL